jgi:membrane protein involved in colicin uptake
MAVLIEVLVMLTLIAILIWAGDDGGTVSGAEDPVMDRATGRDDGSVHQQAIRNQLRHSGVRPHAEYRGPLLRQVLEGVQA